MNRYAQLRSPGSLASPMPEIAADPLSPSCFHLFSSHGVQEYQQLGPDPLLPRARDALGRFAKGSTGNPRGRQRGIPNPPRRVPDLIARPLSAQTLSDLIDRKPHLLHPLAAQLLPPPLAAIDRAARLGIDLRSLRRAEEFRQVLSTVLAAVARGEITPAEGAHMAKRVDARRRAGLRLARLKPRPAAETSPVQTPPYRRPSARLFRGAAAVREPVLPAGGEPEQRRSPVFGLVAGAEDLVADFRGAFDPLARAPRPRARLHSRDRPSHQLCIRTKLRETPGVSPIEVPARGSGRANR
jgi:hypothetical protein